MLNELLSVLKGLYPPFLWLTVIGITVKLYRKEWKLIDTFCAAVILVFLSGVILLPLIFYGEFLTSRRYILIVFPITLLWTAYGWNVCRDHLKRFAIPGIFLRLFFVVLAGFLFYDAYSPIIRKYTSKRKSFERQTILRAADFIRQDYKGPAEAGLDVLICDHYYPDRRPQVSSLFPEIGYLAGGQEHVKNYGTADYLVTWDKDKYKLHYTKADSFVINGRTVTIWRRNGL